MWRVLLSGLLLGAAAFAACTFPEVSFESTPPQQDCSADVDCVQPADPCHRATCIAQKCEDTLAPAGDGCGGGSTCDGMGACIECTAPADCAPDTCQDGHCVASHCIDLAQNLDETDIDCGGADCNPCGDGLSCNGAVDCKSGYCDVSAGSGGSGDGRCAKCNSDNQCVNTPTVTYCDESKGECHDKLGLGVGCVHDNDCQSGFCPEDDFVCCDSACNGTCMGCAQGKTGSPSGECHLFAQGTDPDKDCIVPPLVSCNGNGGCL
jgi:hypothetical protein